MALIGMNAGTPAAAAGATSAHVKDSNDQQFVADVIEASVTQPVIVDFWAPWCGPCRQIGPALEKAVDEAKGGVKLVKINIDENQMIASQLRVQSIPAVYAFFGGRPVDGFVGALPESQIKEFVKKLIALGGNADQGLDAVLEQAEAALSADDAATAMDIYAQILEHDPEHLVAKAGLIRAYLALSEVEAAQNLADSLSDAEKKDAKITQALAALALRAAAGEEGDLAAFEARLATDANDHQARLDLALGLAGQGQHAAAIAQLLDLFGRDRDWNEGAARQQLLKIFDALGAKDPLTLAGRRKLSSMMFS